MFRKFMAWIDDWIKYANPYEREAAESRARVARELEEEMRVQAVNAQHPRGTCRVMAHFHNGKETYWVEQWNVNPASLCRAGSMPYSWCFVHECRNIEEARLLADKAKALYDKRAEWEREDHTQPLYMTES